jgi:hypothetical protein
VNWPARIEIGALDLIAAYAARGFGIGLGVEVPGSPVPAGLKAHPLKGFPSLRIAALWRGRISPLAERVLARLRSQANLLGKG